MLPLNNLTYEFAEELATIPIADSLPDVSRLILEKLPRYFSRRKGKLGPARTFLTVLHMTLFGRRGYRRVIKELLTGALSSEPLWDDDDAPSAASVSKARLKLSVAYCEAALLAVRDACAQSRLHPQRTYKGMHICAFDGTNIALPIAGELSHHFGHASNKSGKSAHPIAGLMMLWNVSCQQPLAFSVSPYGQDERVEARKLFDKLPQNSLLITDRGYPSINFFADLLQHKQSFITRIKKNFYKGMAEHIDKHGNDCLYTFQAKDHRGNIRSGPENNITLRLISITLSTGEREVLATNLWKEDHHHAAALAKLYTARWSIETAFKDMKIDLAIESFSATHLTGIIQEIYAIMIFILLRSELDAQARIEHRIQTKDCDEKRVAVECQFNQSMICDTVRGLLLRVGMKMPTEEVERYLKISLKEIYRYRKKPKPGRRYPRATKGKK